MRFACQLDTHRRTAACLLVLAFAQISFPLSASGQPAPERVRVPILRAQDRPEASRGTINHANVHMGPSSGQEILVLVPAGTILTVLARDKEWIQVRLTPELRKTGMVMRWYKNEDRGWMHDSTVEVLKPDPR